MGFQSALQFGFLIGELNLPGLLGSLARCPFELPLSVYFVRH